MKEVSSLIRGNIQSEFEIMTSDSNCRRTFLYMIEEEIFNIIFASYLNEKHTLNVKFQQI